MDSIILALETSCDETSVAIVKNGHQVLANVISSQVPVHQKFGGVVPEIASRKHLELINTVIDQALSEANMDFEDIGAVAVTYGPGLVGALLVGLTSAKAVAYALGLPLIGVNHIEGHIYANFLENPELAFPLLCLVVSGGHTELIYMEGHGSYEVIGRTRDDAAGEAFDKVARALGLGYPGGPLIDELSREGDSRAIDFPRAYLEGDSLDFSFSGLKSSVLNYLNRAQQKGEVVNKANLAASFQKAVTDVLIDKTVKAAQKREVRTVIMAGGVAANRQLREGLRERLRGVGVSFVSPSIELCTDNAAMIGCAGYYRFLRQQFAPLSINAVPGLKLGTDKY